MTKFFIQIINFITSLEGSDSGLGEAFLFYTKTVRNFYRNTGGYINIFRLPDLYWHIVTHSRDFVVISIFSPQFFVRLFFKALIVDWLFPLKQLWYIWLASKSFWEWNHYVLITTNMKFSLHLEAHTFKKLQLKINSWLL